MARFFPLSTDSGQTFAGRLPSVFVFKRHAAPLLEEEDHCKRGNNIVALPTQQHNSHSRPRKNFPVAHKVNFSKTSLLGEGKAKVLRPFLTIIISKAQDAEERSRTTSETHVDH